MSKHLETVVRKLRTYKGRYPEIAKATGLGLDWLRKFAAGEFRDVGVTKVDALEDWFAKDARE